MIKRYRYRAYPTKEQGRYFNRIFGCCRFVYNWALEKKINHYQNQVDSGVEEPERLSIYDISKELTQLKKNPDYKWLNEPPALALIWSLNHLDDAYKNFFRQVRRGEKPGFPKFKSKYHSKKAFSFHQGYAVDFSGSYITVPKSGKLKTVFHRRFIGDYKTATIIQEPSGKYYVSIVVDDGKAPSELDDPNSLVGIDHGCINSLTASNGKVFDIDTIYPRLEKRLKKEQRNLSRKQVGSNNYQKNKIRVAKIYEKMRFKRRNYIQNMVTDIALYLQDNGYDGIVIRKYDVKSMVEKIKPEQDDNGRYVHNGREVQKKINKKIYAANLGYVFQYMKYKLPECGLHVFEIDASERKTTERCNNCESENVVIDLRKRTIQCKNCGFNDDMDLNAAKNTIDYFRQTDAGLELA